MKEEQMTLYSYNNKSDIHYQVQLKPNILYDKATLDEDKVYITEFVDSIQATFEYQFKGEGKADIVGDYEIVAQMEGYAGNEKEGNTKTIWKKDFILVPKKSFQQNDHIFSIKEDVSLELDDYNNFAAQVLEVSKVGIPVKLSVGMNINFQANTNKGVADVKISPSLNMPINTNYFEIRKNVQDDTGGIQVSKQIQQPVNKIAVTIYIFLDILALSGLLFIIFGTQISTKDPLIRSLKRIFKKHGDRLVALTNEVAGMDEIYNEVKNIEDLVRIADEIGKPIMYQYSENYSDMTKFYVFDDKQVYLFDISKTMLQSMDEQKADEGETAKNI